MCIQEVGEVGIEIEERAGQKSIGFERVAILEGLAEIGRGGAELDAAAIGWIDKTEAVEAAGADEIEGDLSRGIEVVASVEHAEAELLCIAEGAREIAVEIIATVA